MTDIFTTAPSAPVVSIDDVLAVLPAFLRPDDSAPVRDGLFAALTEVLLQCQDDGVYASQQADILKSSGTYLEGLCADRKVFKQAGEGDPQLRARALAIPKLVTPTAILAGINAILSPYTAVQAQYCESVFDRWFVFRSSPTDGNHSYVWGKSVSR